MGKFNPYRALYNETNPEGSDNGKKAPENTYEDIIKELNELNTLNDGNDNVDIKNNELNNALKNYLMANPELLGNLKDRVDGLSKDQNKRDAGGDGLKRLKNFLDNRIYKEMEKDYDEFKGNLSNPKKLSNTNKNELERVNIYLKSNKSKAKEVYPLMQGAYNDVMKLKPADKNVFFNVRNTLKEKYGNDDDFLNLDFPGLNSSISSLKQYTGDDWDGKKFPDDLNGKYDANKTIIEKNTLVTKLNALNTERINGIKEATTDGCFKKLSETFEFKKTTTEGATKLEYKGKNGAPTNYEEITKDGFDLTIFKTELKELIKNNDNIAPAASGQTETDRLWGEWSVNDDFKSGIFDKLVDKATEATNDTVPEIDTGEGIIDKDIWGMDDTDYDSMKDDLKNKMFLSKEGEGESKTYKYNLELVKEYLGKYKTDADDFKLFKTSGTKRREWISAVQILLNKEQGAKGNSGKGLKIDGKFGILNEGYTKGETYNAVLNFQKEYNKTLTSDKTKLDEDGIPGPNTIAALLGGDVSAGTDGGTQAGQTTTGQAAAE